MKKKYTITKTQPALQCWYFEVEAESEEIALHMVMSGDVDYVDYEIHNNYGNDNDDYEVLDIQDIQQDTNN